VDAAGSAARLAWPVGVAVDGAGNLYVADTDNSTIREISPAGVVTTIAGVAGQEGSGDGSGSSARFDYPQGVGVDTAGNVFVADSGNETIRKLTPTTSAGATTWAVTTIAGAAGQAGIADGAGRVARFDSPQGMAVDGEGNLFVADTENCTIRKVTPTMANGITTWVVSTIAGTPTPNTDEYTFADGTGSAARFCLPQSLAVDRAGNVYVADTDFYSVREITPTVVSGVTTWDVTTIAGTRGAPPKYSWAGFSEPWGLAVDGAGNVYVSYTAGDVISKITPTVFDGQTSWAVSLVAGTYPIRPGAYGGNADGAGSAARFDFPRGLAVDGNGNVYVADTENSTIRKITPTGMSGATTWVVTTMAGTPSIGSADGAGSTARFYEPASVAVDNAGHVYVADSENDTIRKISQGGMVGTMAGSVGQAGSADGAGGAAQFDDPEGVAADEAGNVYVADTENDTIREVSPGGSVTTIAGAAGQYGSADGTGSAARFDDPIDVAVDGAGNLYVADLANSTIRKIAPAAVNGTTAWAVTTIAGTAGQYGGEDGTGSAASFNFPYGVAVDGAGNVYVADTSNSTIRKITPTVMDGKTTWTVTTMAGTAGQTGATDGTGAAATFNNPEGVAVDGLGNVYVVDSGNHTIREITAAGSVSTIAGTAGLYGSVDGVGSAIRIGLSQGIAVDRVGNIYVADTGDTCIRKGFLGFPPSIVTQPVSQSVNAGSEVVLVVSATGASSYQWYFNGNAISQATGATLVLGGVTAANAGTYTVDATNGAGTTPSEGATLTVSPAPTSAVITTQPMSQTMNVGGTIVFTVQSSGGTMYQWQFNGVNLSDGGGISGANGPQLVIQGASPSDDGTYACVVTSGSISERSNSAGLQVEAGSTPGFASRISTRALVGTGGNILVGGFHIAGGTSATVLVQALGPSLAAAPGNVAGTLQHPALTIHQTRNGRDVVLYSNTGWGSNPVLLAAAAAAYAEPVLTAGSADSELLLTLPPGDYVAEVSGADNGTGVVLYAIYQVP
jgi:hypothetical protein